MKVEERTDISLKYISSRLISVLLKGLTASALFSNTSEEEKRALDGLISLFEKNHNYTPLANIFKIALERYSCFAIIESPYFDIDTWNIYSTYYSKSFTPCERTCSRIHFFNKSEKNVEALCKGLLNGDKNIKIVLNKNEEHEIHFQGNEYAYKGFTTIRPTRGFVVGKTAVSFDKRPFKELPQIELHDHEKDGGLPFCKTKIKNYVHICGHELMVDAAPFIQQLPIAGVCGATCVWVSAEVLSGRFGLNKFSYDIIGRIAAYSDVKTTIVPRNDIVFSQGLTIKQIGCAIAETGASPHVISMSSGDISEAKVRMLLYTAVESCIPVILLFKQFGGSINTSKGHAISVLGHYLPKSKNNLEEMDASSWIKNIPKEKHFILGMSQLLFYAHNDAYGPFDRITFPNSSELCSLKKRPFPKRRNDAYKNFQMNSKCLFSRGRRKIFNSDLNTIIMPFPRYIQNPPEAIIKYAIELASDHPLFLKFEGVRVLWRFILVESPKFKNKLRTRNYHENAIKYYTKMHLPLFIWVAEFTLFIDEAKELVINDDRKINGELICDASTPTQAKANSIISIRTGNLLFDYGKKEKVRFDDKIVFQLKPTEDCLVVN